MSDTKAKTINLTEIPIGEIYAELNLVLQSPDFERSPRIKDFLNYIVRETVENRSEYIKGYSIALAVFGRDEAFDPSSDPLVRVQGVRLRRMLEKYYLTLGVSNTLRIALPKGSYIPIFCRQQTETDAVKPKANETADVVQKSEPKQLPTIAILPLENLNTNSELDYFSDGLSEEIISGLSRFTELAVLSRHTSFQFRGQQFDIRKLRSDIGADYLLEGSIRQADSKIRVTARLLETEQGTCLWNDRYDCELTVENLFDLQADISDKVVSAVAAPYGVIKRTEQSSLRNHRICSLNAYQWVLKFYQYWNGAFELHEELRDALENCVESDRNDRHFAGAWAALAFLYLDEYRFYLNPRPAGQPPLERAFEAATRATELNPDSPMALQALFCSHFHRQEIDEFLLAGERALELNPNHADMLADFGTNLFCIGDHERGLELTDKAIRLSPTHPGWYHTARCMHLYWNGDYRRALNELKQFNMPQIFGYLALLGATYAKLECPQEAAHAVECLTESHPAFVDKPRFELRKWNIDEDFIDALLGGLKMAGMAIEQRHES